MNPTKSFFLALICASGIALSNGASAQMAEPSEQTSTSDQTVTSDPIVPAQESSWWDRAKNKANNILDHGQLSMDLSGWARHGRGTYTPERIAELNEKAWGIGFNKALRDDKDNEELLYGMIISDSHFRPQPMAGYAYQWMKPISDKWEIGGGYTVAMISRTDYFKGVPFPAPLPVASIGTRGTKLMAAYVPRFSKNKGNGDVLLMFVRFDLN